jgi:RNA polymerase sigma-70 factor, ECF subfamily
VTSPSDAELVACVLRGERELYAPLVQRHQAMLYRHALGMVADSDAAADLVQDSFIKAYLSLRHCQDPARFGAWVFRILKNRCHDYLRDRRRQTVPLEHGGVWAEAPENPRRDLEQRALGQAIEGALARLPDAQRQAFLLKHVEGCSYEEMTELLEASTSALKMRVMRAREALQELLEGWVGADP